METWTIVGCVAAFCGAVSLIPEVIKAHQTHHLQDISWGTLIFLLAGSSLWGTYGLHIGDIPLVASASTNLVLEITLITMKKAYAHKKRKLDLKITVVPAREKVEV